VSVSTCKHTSNKAADDAKLLLINKQQVTHGKHGCGRT